MLLSFRVALRRHQCRPAQSQPDRCRSVLTSNDWPRSVETPVASQQSPPCDPFARQTKAAD